MKKIIIAVLACIVTLSVAQAVQNSDASIRQVRDPVQLKALLDSNAADAQSRLAAIEAIEGAGGALAPGQIVIGNAATVATAVAVSGAMTIETNGVTTLVGNIPVARITNAAATVGASIGGNIPVAAISNAVVSTYLPASEVGRFNVVGTTQLVFIASGVTNVIDADITTP